MPLISPRSVAKNRPHADTNGVKKRSIMPFTRKSVSAIEGMTPAMVDAVMQLHGVSMADYTPKADVETKVKEAVDAAVAEARKDIGDTDLKALKARAELADKLEKDLEEAGYREKARNANVNPKLVRAVVHEVAGQVTKELDFDAALKAYIEENPEFVTTSPAGGTQVPPGTPGAPAGGLRQGAAANAKTEVAAVLDSKYKNNPYYTPKQGG